MKSYWLITGMFILSGILFHLIVVTPILRRNGYKSLNTWIFPDPYLDLARYKRICLREGKSLALWRIMLFFQIATVVLVVGSFFLLVYETGIRNR